MVNLSYGNGRTVRVPKGLSVLEASLRNNVPHASVCGGRARCSTCRIRIIGDCSALPQPSQREAFVLGRVGTSDPSIRLACQLRPATDLSFFQLFLPHTAADGHGSNPTRIGQERYLVNMFVDMRGSTKLAEKRLPFDTVFIVNRFLGAVSQAVIDAGGRPNQFVGDGMLALFEITASRQEVCRQALMAAALSAWRQTSCRLAVISNSASMPSPTNWFGRPPASITACDTAPRNRLTMKTVSNGKRFSASLVE